MKAGHTRPIINGGQMTFLASLVQGAKKQNLEVELTNQTKVENVAGEKRKVDIFFLGNDNSIRFITWQEQHGKISSNAQSSVSIHWF